jgi:tRNA(Ile)-lysidine synthase
MPRARCEVEARLLEFLTKRGFCPDDPIAVAYSGGPDSGALLAALAAIGWRRPMAIHVDHGIRSRDELDTELALIKGFCSSLGASLTVAHLRPGAVIELARSSGEGVEAAARRYRYAALRRGMKKRGAVTVLLAHTQNDQLETLLMRLLGGSGAGGLKGIPECSGAFLRPFLGTQKAELTSYLAGKGLPYSVDSTNDSEDYLRNRIRKVLVPLLDGSFPGWRRGLSAASSKAAMDEAALSAWAERIAFAQPEEGRQVLSVDASAFLEAPRAVAMRALIRAAGRLRGRGRFPAAAAAAALDAVGQGRQLYRGAGLELERCENGRILLRSWSPRSPGGLDFPPRHGYFVLIDRPCRVRVGKLEVCAVWRDASGPAGVDPGIRADAFRFPIVVRSRRPGDALALKAGTKRLDELFSEWALSERARGAVPVIEDRDGIVAVLASGLGGRDRFRERPEGAGANRLSVIVKGA